MPASSPCTGLCVIDETTGLCAGCLRSLPEIATWGSLTEAQRRAIMQALPARRARSDAGGAAARSAGVDP